MQIHTEKPLNKTDIIQTIIFKMETKYILNNSFPVNANDSSVFDNLLENSQNMYNNKQNTIMYSFAFRQKKNKNSTIDAAANFVSPVSSSVLHFVIKFKFPYGTSNDNEFIFTYPK